MSLSHILSTLIVSFLTLSSTVQARESFTLSQNATESHCFPVRLNQEHSPGYVNLHLASYHSTAKDGFPEVAVLIARRDDLNYKKKYYKDKGGSYKTCTIEAVKDGYCTHRRLGKYLYELNDPFGLANDQNTVYDDILWELGTYESVFPVKESGYYCVFSHSEDAQDYEIDVEVIDHHRFTNEQRMMLTIADLEMIFNGLFLIGFATVWNFWSIPKLNEIPFAVRFTLLSTSFGLLLNSLVKLDLQYFDGSFGLMPILIDFCSEIYSLLILLGVYHFSLDFSYSFDKNLLKDKEGLLYFGLALVLSILGSVFPNVTLFTNIKVFLEAFIIIITLVKYRLIAEEYSHSLSLSSLKHYQFRSLILTTLLIQFGLPYLFLNRITMQAFNVFVFPEISPFISYLAPSFTNLLIDSSLEKMYGDLELPLFVAVLGMLIKFYGTWVHWTPKAVNSALKLDETLKKLQTEKNQ
ncbi:hypothetical protein WICPIJ_008722 [Wickerhamomyces pijperi]|uniref:PTM1-like N-terminal domain-containing protein n=1 Tax=Wickerhamomyces pijperi TaxID=599730 RepID=A0A9P8THM0_WICPI|nr:hypothetical protein WICPIJ_008722 [Wickerhamomyces pijperi]